MVKAPVPVSPCYGVATMNADNLAARRCVPCTEHTQPLETRRIHELLQQVPGWQLTPDGQRLTRSWRVRDFLTGLDFFRRIGEVAEAEDHHPDLHLVGYRNVTVELWTHAAGGLTENDFILAAKINGLEPPALKT
jgi:4a-hydroxytetrahydrobiopterin dehydratase